MAKKIIHIDDDDDIRLSVKTLLKSEGYEVVSFECVNNVMESIDKIKPDLIIADVMLDRVDDGLKIFDEISKGYPNIPIIFLTSLGEEIRPYFQDNQHLIKIIDKEGISSALIPCVKQTLKSSS